MKKLLSALTLAAAGLISQVANASGEGWKNDPDFVYFSRFPYSGCLKSVDGKIERLTYDMEVLAMRPSWEKATAGKSDSEKVDLQDKILSVALRALDDEWRTRTVTLTIADVENKTPAYNKALRDAFNEKIPETLLRETGVEAVVGSHEDAMVYPSCKLQ